VDAQPEADFSSTERALTTVSYKRTAAPQPLSDADRDLSLHISAPLTGTGMAAGFYAGTYGGSLTWETGGTAAAGFFRGGMEYTVKVSLYAAPGYTLAGSVFTHAGGTPNGDAEWTNTGSFLTGMTIAFPETDNVAAVVVGDLDLTDKVPAPVTGGTPVTYFSSPQYTGTAAWSAGGTPFTGVFQTGTAYTATVTLTAAAGYTFEGVRADAIVHLKAASETNKADSGVVTIAFPGTNGVAAAAVDDPELTRKIPAPVWGGTPVTYFSSPQYTGWVDWFADGTAAPHSVFQADTAYTAEVTLTAASGRTLSGTGAFTHDGAKSAPAVADNGNGTATITIIFPATTGVTAAAVNDLNLTDKVPAPVRGGTPVRYFSAPQYTGNVAWAVSPGGQALGGIFEEDTRYRAAVTLTAMSGYTLEGISGNFTHAGALLINHTTEDTVTFTFPATSSSSVPAVTINGVDLTNYLPAPITGATPKTSFNAVTYTGTAAWTTSAGVPVTLFEANTVYTAAVTLYPASGYVFPTGNVPPPTAGPARLPARSPTTAPARSRGPSASRGRGFLCSMTVPSPGVPPRT
jgi:hypothetical protein